MIHSDPISGFETDDFGPSGRSRRPRPTSSPADRPPVAPNGSVQARCWTGRLRLLETERGGCRQSSHRPAEPHRGRPKADRR
jgi:hypothetical protein